MKIKSVYVSKLFNEYDFALDMGQPLTFVHSPNGLGKSTLMRMIYAALRGDVDYLRGTPFSRFDILFDDDEDLVIQNYQGEMLVLMRKSDVDTDLTPSDMASIVETLYVPPERLAIKRGDGHLAPTLEVYAQELADRIRYAREHRELESVLREGVSEMSDDDLEFWCKDLKAKLDFIRDAGFEPDIPAGKKFPPSRYEIAKDRKGYEELASSLADYVEKDYILAESVIIFKDIVNDIFLNKSVTVSDTGRIGVAMNNGTALQLQKLSSGEKQILIMFYALLFHAPQGSIVIIDEPEISLHVCWQQKLGDYLLDICRVRDIQMIVATHSPQIIHDKWDMARELRPTNARVPDDRGHLQRAQHGAHRVRRGVPDRRGHNRQQALRQVRRPGRGQHRHRSLQGQRPRRGEGDVRPQEGPEDARHHGPGP